MIRYELERVLISKKLKKCKVYLNPEVLELSHEFVPIGTPKGPFALLGAELVFEFWSNLDSFFKDFLAWNCT